MAWPGGPARVAGASTLCDGAEEEVEREATLGVRATGLGSGDAGAGAGATATAVLIAPACESR